MIFMFLFCAMESVMAVFVLLLVSAVVSVSVGQPNSESLPDNGGVGKTEQCVCVQYFQCVNGYVITNGSGLIDPRRHRPGTTLDQRCNEPLQTCCLRGKPATERPRPNRCGSRHVSSLDRRILNSTPTKYGEWPWQAVLLENSWKKVFLGGAVLIDDQHVVTAAHKVYRYREFPDKLLVSLGAWNLSASDERRQELDVTQISIHTAYDNDSLVNDIAILKLNGTVVYNDVVSPICLPKHKESHSDRLCSALGWGQDTFGGRYSPIMKLVRVKIVKADMCETALRQTRLGTFFNLDPSFICAGGKEGLDACVGDGGGALQCTRNDGTYSLIGLVSWGIDCGQPKIPGVYVNVNRYMKWISKTTKRPMQYYWS